MPVYSSSTPLPFLNSALFAFFFANMPSAPNVPAFPDVSLPVRQLRFTHDTIRPLFHAGVHSGKSLYTLVNALCVDPDRILASLPALEVVKWEGAWRCLSNRRLWCLRAYEGLSGAIGLRVRVKILTQLPRNFMEKNTRRNDGLSVQVIGDEDILRASYKNFRKTCRHHFGPRGCTKGSRCSYSHDQEADNPN